MLGWDHGTKNRVMGKSGSRGRFINAMNEFISRPRDRMIVRRSAASGPVCSCICIQVVGELSEGLDGVGDVVKLAPIFCVHLYSIICQFPQKPRISKIPELITLQPFSIFMGGG